MYDITKTRMLLTTAVFAAVAAVFAGGASARIPEEDGSDIGAEPVAVVVAPVDPLASSRLAGLLRAARTRDRESGALSGEQEAPQGRGTFFVDPEICAALDPAIKAAIQECSHAAPRAAKPIVPVLDASEATQGVSEWDVISRSDVVSRYIDNSRTGTGQQRVARARHNKFPDGYRGLP
jgi:hypothetical protein